MKQYCELCSEEIAGHAFSAWSNDVGTERVRQIKVCRSCYDLIEWATADEDDDDGR